MINLIARLSRTVPGIILLVVIALAIYLFVAWRSSPERAKELLIRIFSWLFIVLAAFFALLSLYAWGDGHQAVLDLSLSFLVVALVGLGIVRLCNYFFLKHHPHYRDKTTSKARVKHRFPWERR